MEPAIQEAGENLIMKLDKDSEEINEIMKILIEDDVSFR